LVYVPFPYFRGLRSLPSWNYRISELR